MVNWTDHGIIAGVADPKTFKWADGNNAWAPSASRETASFISIVPCCVQEDDVGIGVAVSDSPYGPFTDPIGKPLILIGNLRK